MLDSARISEVREKARTALKQAWSIWDDKSVDRLNVLEFVRNAPELIIEQILGFKLETPAFLAIEDIQKIGAPPGFTLAGFFDRPSRRVVVLSDTRADITRFTTAHEIAHIILHPRELLHRDRPVSGCERKAAGRPDFELEADIFAAELIMPERLVRSEFSARFGSVLDGRALNVESANAAFGLRLPRRRQINSMEFVQRGKEFRAFLAATAVGFHARPPFLSMASEFGVSPSAMAIRLTEFGLVL